MAKCIPLPKVTAPSLPSPFSIPKPTLPVPPNLAFCCKLPQIPEVDLPIKIPGTVDPAIVAQIRAGIAVVVAYLNAQEIPCPRE